ncbi:uncharacterized protein BXZ73DRAFT_92571 [Epithele typhae]|uniref:uncharacterized protein n=1 Tax=Epithele typhae TaxID=378194 RepID=UPI002008272A|nr:uncharacterized protein BXZ73DRAFT_92571 [Epithele typhae]KAH9915792.1 hypothetical protein BXZ73DRAFT_92571 [Epithele typhae]
MTVPTNAPETRAATVFCGSSKGAHAAFAHAASSLGKALAQAKRPLVYGGGSAGTMGVVSLAALEAGGEVTGVIPFAMASAGGERDQVKGTEAAHLSFRGGPGREKVVTNSMHERKAEMARRSCAFFGLPGGLGTFEEVLEVACWSQLGIHRKPVILLNVRNFWDPLKLLVRNGIENGFILPANERLIRYVEGPEDVAEHDTFDWGAAAVAALDQWDTVQATHFYNWHLRKEGETDAEPLGAA